MKAKLIYDSGLNIISYIRGDLIISAILKGYDKINGITLFDNGYAELKMIKDSKEVEDFVDFKYALSLIGLNKLSDEYFNTIELKDLSVSNKRTVI